MTPEVAIVLGLIVVAMVLFSKEWFSIDVVTLGLMAALVVTGILTPDEAFQGFGSEIIIILASIMVLAGAIVKAGVLDWLGGLAYRLSGANRQLTMLSLMSLSAASSAFFSNTNTTAILTPPSMEAARHAKMSPSRVLMPVAFASILGGSATLIGTSTNLAGSAMTQRLGLEPFSMFEFAIVGMIIASAGIAWMVVANRWLVPDRRPAESADDARPRDFMTTLKLKDGSAAIGKTIEDLNLDEMDTDPLLVFRNRRRLPVSAVDELKEGDQLVVRASREGLLKLKKSDRYSLEPDEHFSGRMIEDTDFVLVEALISPQSRLVGRTIKQLGFFDRFQGIVLAVYRHDWTHAARIENLKLKGGDVLLLQGPKDEFQRLHGGAGIRVLMEVDQTVLTPKQGAITLGVLGAAIIAGSMGILPLSVAMLLAVLVVVVSGGIAMEEAYRFIEWRLLVLIGGMTSFGLAMENSGAAAYIADLMVSVSAPMGPTFSMAAFAILTVALTQPMSNAAAALTVLPVAVAAAPGLGLEPRTLAVLVTLSASMSFITPLEPACLLVYGPGRYKFFDFVRAGTPLTIISIGLLLVLVPIFWP